MFNRLTIIVSIVSALVGALVLSSSPVGAQASAEMLPVGSYTYECDEGQTLQLVGFDPSQVTIQCGTPGGVVAAPSPVPAYEPARLNNDCAARVEKRAEYMPANTSYNQRRVAVSERGHAQPWFGDTLNKEFDATVRGDYVGTTDEILQYYACVYRLDLTLVRAVAWTESSHDFRMNGDAGESWGIMQVRNSRESHYRSFPAARLSTAYNVEYWAFNMRACMDGRVPWLGTQTRNNGLGCAGVHYSGATFMDGKSYDYRVRVQNNMRSQPWKAAWK